MIPRTPTGPPKPGRGVGALFSRITGGKTPSPTSDNRPPPFITTVSENNMQAPSEGVHTAVQELLSFIPSKAMPQAQDCIGNLTKAINDITTALATRDSELADLRQELTTLRAEREQALQDVHTARKAASQTTKELHDIANNFPELITNQVTTFVTETLDKQLPQHLKTALEEAQVQLEERIYQHAQDTAAIYNDLVKETNTASRDVDRRTNDIQQQLDTVRTLIDELQSSHHNNTTTPVQPPAPPPPPPRPPSQLNEELIDRPNQDANTNKLIFRICSEKAPRAPSVTVDLARDAIRTTFNIDAQDLLPIGQARPVRLWNGAQGHAQLVEARFPANTNAIAFMRRGRDLLRWCTDHAAVPHLGPFRIYMDSKLTPWQARTRASQAGLMRDLLHQFRDHRAHIGIYWQGHRIKATLRSQATGAHQARPPTNIFPANTPRATILSWITDNAPADFQVPPVPPTPARQPQQGRH